jgi:hypothetical protein
MKKICFFILVSVSVFKAQNCKSLFSFGAQFEKVTFYNQSTVSNAHFYWNFGDGTASNFQNPTHIFPGNGIFLVTLYVNDLVNNCSDYYEQWITITKNYLNPCSPSIYDSIYNYNNANYLKIIDVSKNCAPYIPYYVSVGGNNLSNIYYLDSYPANFISYVQYINNTNEELLAVKTSPYLYNRSKNYQDCSANFEFSVVSEDNVGQRILFTPMNKRAKKYEWTITGFGVPININSDTTSVYYHGPTSIYQLQGFVYLKTTGQNGCTDSLIQKVALRKKNTTYVGIKENLSIDEKLKVYPNPTKKYLTLECQDSFAKITITNLLGQTVYQNDSFDTSQNIDLSALSKSIYFLKVEIGRGQKVIKIIKE